MGVQSAITISGGPNLVPNSAMPNMNGQFGMLATPHTPNMANTRMLVNPAITGGMQWVQSGNPTPIAEFPTPQGITQQERKDLQQANDMDNNQQVYCQPGHPRYNPFLQGLTPQGAGQVFSGQNGAQFSYMQEKPQKIDTNVTTQPTLISIPSKPNMAQ